MGILVMAVLGVTLNESWLALSGSTYCGARERGWVGLGWVGLDKVAGLGVEERNAKYHAR